MVANFKVVDPDTPWYLREGHSSDLGKIEFDDEGNIVLEEVDERAIAEALLAAEGRVKVIRGEQSGLARREREAKKIGAVLAIVDRETHWPRLTQALAVAELDVAKAKAGELAIALLRAKAATVSVDQVTEQRRDLLRRAQALYDEAAQASSEHREAVHAAARALDYARRAIEARVDELGLRPPPFDRIECGASYGAQMPTRCRSCGNGYSRPFMGGDYVKSYFATGPAWPGPGGLEVCHSCAVRIDADSVAKERGITPEAKAEMSRRLNRY